MKKLSVFILSILFTAVCFLQESKSQSLKKPADVRTVSECGFISQGAASSKANFLPKMADEEKSCTVSYYHNNSQWCYECTFTCGINVVDSQSVRTIDLRILEDADFQASISRMKQWNDRFMALE